MRTILLALTLATPALVQYPVPGGVFWFAIMSGGCHHHRDY